MFASTLLFTSLSAFALATPAKRSLPSGDVTCGSDVYTVSEISSAVSDGYSHMNDPIGSDSYPHQYYDDENLDMYCSGSTWYEFPIMPGGLYDGGDPETDRVVFNSEGTYCAVITHTGASSYDGFVACKGD